MWCETQTIPLYLLLINVVSHTVIQVLVAIPLSTHDYLHLAKMLSVLQSITIILLTGKTSSSNFVKFSIDRGKPSTNIAPGMTRTLDTGVIGVKDESIDDCVEGGDEGGDEDKGEEIDEGVEAEVSDDGDDEGILIVVLVDEAEDNVDKWSTGLCFVILTSSCRSNAIVTQLGKIWPVFSCSDIMGP